VQQCRVHTNTANVLGGGYAVTGIMQWGLKRGLLLHREREEGSSGVGKYYVSSVRACDDSIGG